MFEVRYICYAAYNGIFAEAAKRIFEKLGKDVWVQVWDPDDLAFVQNDKIKVIIARGGTAINIRAAVDKPVVEIPIPFDELIKALLKASTLSKSIGVIGYTNLLNGLELLNSIINVDLKQVFVQNEEEMFQQMVKLRDEGVEVIVGGICQTMMARELGMQAVLIELSEVALESAYNEAASILEKIIYNIRKNEVLNTVINHSDEGYLAIDRQGKITIANHVASRLMSSDSEPLIGKRLTDCYPEFVKLTEVLEADTAVSQEMLSVNGHKIICRMKPLKLDDESVIGAIATFNDIKTIASAEHHIRQALLNKGLYASYTFADIVGESQATKELIEIAHSYARTHSTVLITGETGVGKELLAQSIHNASRRHREAFVAINCASIPESILESELFGYVEGAFTGARKGGKIGLFELAHKGTIFLDEISEMPLALQGRLLRVLQERQIVRLGSDQVIPIDIRIIAATNRDIKALANASNFRKDLFYRLDVLTLLVPPLRERQADIQVLAKTFWKKYNGATRVLSEEALKCLCTYTWPGNIRQLKSFVEKVSVISKKEVVDGATIRDMLKKYEYVLDAVPEKAATERDDVLAALKVAGGNKSKAADSLGIHRSTLWRLMKKYDLLGGERSD